MAFEVPHQKPRREKLVFGKSEELAEKFAMGSTKGSARDGRIFIDGDTIYSYGYHFPIARRINPTTFELTTKKYSVTTTKQTSTVHRALARHGFTVIEKEL